MEDVIYCAAQFTQHETIHPTYVIPWCVKYNGNKEENRAQQILCIMLSFLLTQQHES